MFVCVYVGVGVCVGGCGCGYFFFIILSFLGLKTSKGVLKDMEEENPWYPFQCSFFPSPSIHPSPPTKG